MSYEDNKTLVDAKGRAGVEEGPDAPNRPNTYQFDREGQPSAHVDDAKNIRYVFAGMGGKSGVKAMFAQVTIEPDGSAVVARDPQGMVAKLAIQEGLKVEQLEKGQLRLTGDVDAFVKKYQPQTPAAVRPVR